MAAAKLKVKFGSIGISKTKKNPTQDIWNDNDTPRNLYDDHYDFFGDLDDAPDELDEEILLEDIIVNEQPIPQPEQEPEPETAEKYLKDWFNRLSGDIRMNKFIHNDDHYFFDNDNDKGNYPFLYFPLDENIQCKISYKGFTMELTREEALKYSRIFKKGFNDYYMSIFKRKVEEIDRPARRYGGSYRF